MWKDKGFELVLLPTETKESIGMLCVRNTDSKLCRHTKEIKWHGVNQYLYLLSDEVIRENDSIYLIVMDDMGNEMPVIAKKKVGIRYMDSSTEKKVIACNDPSLNLPQFPSFFLEEYVNRYNSKKSLEVEVGYDSNVVKNGISELMKEEYYQRYPEDLPDYVCKHVTNVDNNTISIRFKQNKPCTHEVVKEAMKIASKDVRTPDIYRMEEKRYGQVEMEMRLLEGIAHAISYPEKFVTGIYLDSTKVKNWIKENLK